MNPVVEGIKAISIVAMILTFIPVMIWFERKGAAYIQDRRGPNRAAILGIRLGGMIHNIADVIKLLTKEDIIPDRAHRVFYIAAPMIAIFVACVTVGVVPFAEPFFVGDYLVRLQIADLNVGLLYILAIGSLGVYGVLLAGWSPSNSYTLLGGLRASAQMISYELAMGLAMVSLLICAGTVRIPEIVAAQGGSVFHWFIFQQPVAFLLFLVALFAETNRNPFDLPEGESELVAGFHTEYSSMKFALFFMAEYAHIVVAAVLLATLFCGGWHLPGVDWDAVHVAPGGFLRMLLAPTGVLAILLGIFLLRRFKQGRYGDLRDYEVVVFGAPAVVLGLGALIVAVLLPGSWAPPEPFASILVATLQAKVVIIKTLIFAWLFIQVRWTLPRFRYDQLMRLGWKYMLPIALANITVTAIWVGLS